MMLRLRKKVILEQENILLKQKLENEKQKVERIKQELENILKKHNEEIKLYEERIRELNLALKVYEEQKQKKIDIEKQNKKNWLYGYHNEGAVK